ncbi:MAG TPA: BrnA antitoxin family protein [Burkholderiaceae bacterium]|nr:BrnA antitoxin family protein [Burkholderiaceae bacterium]
MSKPSTAKTSADARADAPLRRADIRAGKLVLRKRGPGGAMLPNKRRVNIFLDGAVIEHFKTKAGDRGYQTLINEALKQAIQAESIEGIVRKAIREELRRG